MQQQIIKEIFQLVVKRPDSLCNFLEGSRYLSNHDATTNHSHAHTRTRSLLGGAETKIIYRHYATLYFVFAVDESESELGILDLIQVK